MINLLKTFQGATITINYGTTPAIFVVGEVIGVYSDYVAIKVTVAAPPNFVVGTTVNISIKDINVVF